MNISPFVYSHFFVVAKECDEICHIGINEFFEFAALLKCLNVMGDKSCRRYSLSREDNLLLKSDNYAMKILILFSVIEFQSV